MSLRPTVLAVDDDPLMRALLGNVFSQAGYVVETFESAQDLLEHGDLERPAVILLDLKMPGMTGLELQVVLRQRGVTLPIVFLTGSSDVASAVEAMRRGAADFVEKPFARGDLVDRVRRSLDAFLAPVAANPTRDDDGAARLLTLTVRERQIHLLMIQGKSSKDIARELGGSFRTVETHRARVMKKMAAANVVELVRKTFDPEPT